MKFSVAAFLALLSTAAAVDPAVLSALLGDLKAHSGEYISYIQANPQAYPASLYALVQQASTATNLNALASQFPTAEFSSFLTGFPYASRVESEISAAQAGASAGASSAVASSAPASSTASSAASSAAASSTAAKSTAAAASNTTGGAAASNTTSGSSSTASSGAGKAAKLALLPVALFSALAFAL